MESEQLIKNDVLSILKAFDKYCNQHEIHYVLAYGTLLGAVRHKGFIPWDDDIDIVMLPDEYTRLKGSVAADRFLDDAKRYRIYFPGDPGYGYSFPKVIDTYYVIREKNVSDKYNLGLFIDIFRADYWPDNKLKEFFQLNKSFVLRKIKNICVRGNLQENKFIILDKIIKPIDLLFRLLGITTEKVCLWMDHVGAKNVPNRYVGVIQEGEASKKEKMDSSIYNNIIHLPFEDHLFPAPKDFDIYLNTLYGDYMTLPPETDRIGHEYEIISKK